LSATRKASLRYAKTNSAPVELTYKEIKTPGSQARLTDRFVLQPVIDMKAYTCRAVVDWIDIVVQTKNPTQHQWVQRAIEPTMTRKPFVEALDAGPGKVAFRFRIRFQEPHIASVIESVRRLEEAYAFDHAPHVTALEVSIDLTPREPSNTARGLMLGTLFRHFSPTRDVFENYEDRPRYAWKANNGAEHVFPARKHTAFDPTVFLSADRDMAPPIDSTLYVGRKGGPSMWRLMDKIIDTQNKEAGTYIELSANEKRSRIEVTLDRSSLENEGIYHLENLVGFNFTRFQKSFFQFCLPTFRLPSPGSSASLGAVQQKLEDERLRKFLVTGIIGIKAMDAEKRRFRRLQRPALLETLQGSGITAPPLDRKGTGTAGTTVAFKEMNARVSMALQKLTHREATE